MKNILSLLSLISSLAFGAETSVATEVELQTLTVVSDDPLQHRLTLSLGYQETAWDHWSFVANGDCFVDSKAPDIRANTLAQVGDKALQCHLLEMSARYETFTHGFQFGRFDNSFGQSELTRPSQPARFNIRTSQSPFQLRQGLDQVQTEILLEEKGAIQLAAVHAEGPDENFRVVPLASMQYMLDKIHLGSTVTERFYGYRASYELRDDTIVYLDGSSESWNRGTDTWHHHLLAGFSLSFPKLSTEMLMEYYWNESGLSRRETLQEWKLLATGRRPTTLGRQGNRAFPVTRLDAHEQWAGSSFLGTDYLYLRLRFPEWNQLIIARLQNLADASSVLSMSAQWPLVDSTSLTAEGRLMNGRAGSEFHFYGKKASWSSLYLGATHSF